jgi:GntR family transcriptional repressor for pyruvate dehydrogenase complex
MGVAPSIAHAEGGPQAGWKVGSPWKAEGFCMPTPVRDRVTEVSVRLEEMILSHQLATGALLPPERELSAQMGVSRSVVREALRRLQSVGLVTSLQGSGTRVAEPTGKQVVVGYERLMRHAVCSLKDLSSARAPLETTIAAMAAEHRTDDDLARLEMTQNVLGDPSCDLQTHINADVSFHALLAEATRNPIFPLLLSPIQELLVESRRQTLSQYGAQLAHEHHATILAAVRARDAAAASQAMARHMETNLHQLASCDAPVVVKASGPATL